MMNRGPRSLHCRSHGTARGDVVVLDEHAVKETDAVIVAATDANSVFLEEP